MADKTEYWDILDVRKQKTGRRMRRNDWNMQPGEYHLTVLGIVTNLQGHCLITQRKLDKEWAPGSWEVSGGGVKAGETSEEAVLREVHEETGLDTAKARVELLGDYRSDSPEEKNNYFVDIYHLTMDFRPEDVHPQASETEGFRLVDAGTIQQLGEAGQFLHYQRLLPYLKKLLSF